MACGLPVASFALPLRLSSFGRLGPTTHDSAKKQEGKHSDGRAKLFASHFANPRQICRYAKNVKSLRTDPLRSRKSWTAAKPNLGPVWSDRTATETSNRCTVWRHDA